MIAGGPKLDTEMDVFNMTHEAISRGAAGVDMGRNIWQRENPVAIIRAIRGIVHENMTPKQAHELFTGTQGERLVTCSPRSITQTAT